MNKLTYTVITTFLSFTLFSSTSKAQELIGSGQADAPRLALSVNAGLTFPYTDVKPQKTGLVVGVGAAFFATPYLHVNLDAQKGWLKGGDKINASGIMGSENSYYSGALTVRFLPLMLMNNSKNAALRFFGGLYGGVGAGIISNAVKSNTIISPEFGSLGGYTGISFMVPIEAGINIPIAKMANNNRLLFNLNYRVNLCMSDKIDGYVPLVEANRKNDAFNTLTAGFVFNF
jgi:hypothetical protein